jgi:hypothetical protein
MNEKLSHAKEFELLFKEALVNMKETFRTELLALTGIAAFYGWLFLHRTYVPLPLVYYVGPAFVFTCGIRALALVVRLYKITQYLRKIEEHEFGKHAALPGWERFLTSEGTWPIVSLAALLWITMFGLTVYASSKLASAAPAVAPAPAPLVFPTNAPVPTPASPFSPPNPASSFVPTNVP